MRSWIKDPILLKDKDSLGIGETLLRLRLSLKILKIL